MLTLRMKWIVLLALFTSCATVPGRRFQTGMASFYGAGFDGRKTASGEIFDRNLMTAAHRTLPFGTKLRVRNRANGKEVVVRVNDRGPFAKGRILDLSEEAARRLDFIREGHTEVEIFLFGTRDRT